MRYRSEIGTYLNSRGLLGVGVEIGVHTGLFSEQLLLRWRGLKLWLVDPWCYLGDYLDSFNASDLVMEKRYQRARRRLGKWGGRVGWLRMRSEVAASYFDDESCDFVYIDANHSYEHVRRDLKLWYPKVRPGGLVSGHDYFDALPDHALEPIIAEGIEQAMLTSYGVKSAVDEFAMTIGAVVGYTSEKLPTWYFEKPGKQGKRARRL